MFGSLDVADRWEISRDYEYYPQRYSAHIVCPECVVTGEPFDVSVILEPDSQPLVREQPRVRWITLYFFPELYLNPLSGNHSQVGQSPAVVSYAVSTCRINEGGTLYAFIFYNVQEFFYSRKKIRTV